MNIGFIKYTELERLRRARMCFVIRSKTVLCNIWGELCEELKVEDKVGRPSKETCGRFENFAAERELLKLNSHVCQDKLTAYRILD